MTDLPEKSAVPEWMKDRNQWRLWSRESKPPKKPLDQDATGRGWNDPGCWLSFDEAYQLARDDQRFDGLGFVVSNSDPFYGIDVDSGLREPFEEKPKEWVPTLGPFEGEVYGQFSTSGTGFHLFGRGELPEWWSDVQFDDREHEGVEAYEEKFFIVTGEPLSISAEEPGEVDPLPFLVKAHKSITGRMPKTGTADSDSDSREVDQDTDREIVENAIDALDPDMEHTEWVRVGFAVHDWDDGSAGRRVFEDWSQQGTKWDTDAERTIEWIWNHAKQGGDVTAGTLFHKAQEAGWEFPKASTDGGATTADKPQSQPAPVSLNPRDVLAAAGKGEDDDVSDLDDREKAACVWEILRQVDGFHVRVRRDNGSLWGYDGGVWKPEGERTLRHAARLALGSMNYGANVLSELKAQARSDPAAEIKATDMGTDPGKIAVENGLLDLDDAAKGHGNDAIRPLRPEDYALAQLPVEYDPKAEYDEWKAYVEEWAEDGKAEALQEYVGYCLQVNELPIHRALLLVGSGANGKSTFLNVVRALLGDDNTTALELQTLANEQDAVADFYGSIANIDDDLSARKLGKGLGMFKKLTGDNEVRGRHLYEEGFKFKATGKHLYAANEVPQVDVDDNDEAFWRRWLLVEFPNHYPPSARDPKLKHKFTDPEALSGVLNWAIEGRHRLFENGYFSGESQYAHEKRERWQKWGDTIDKFVSECCERDEGAPNVSTTEVHRIYAKWCRDKGEQPGSQQMLTNSLKSENYDYSKSVRPGGTGTPTRGFKALGFTDDAPELEDTPERDTRQNQLG